MSGALARSGRFWSSGGWLGAILPPALVLLAVGLAVEWAKAAGLLPITIPAPSQVAAVAPAQAADLWWHAQSTLRNAALGYVISAFVAFTLAGVALSLARAERPILSIGVAIDCIPIIALAPIFAVWVGAGPTLGVVIAGIAAFFPLLLGAVQGFKATDANARELFHVMAASRWQRLRLLSWPSALPFIFAAFKIAAPLSLLGALIAEWMGTDRGLGAMIIYALFSFNVPVVWLTILTVCAISALAYGLIALVESRVVTWGTDAEAGG
ncbi:MAG: ABC transporter permease subunit [Rubellimicrobium sp.]|nr:ABC transporter permease subunit [Rubellimicrobium sp.]